MAGEKGDDPVANHVSGQANKPMSLPAHALTSDQVAQELSARLDGGLNADEATKRLEDYGRNEFGEQPGVQPVKIFVGQIANALTLVGPYALDRTYRLN